MKFERKKWISKERYSIKRPRPTSTLCMEICFVFCCTIIFTWLAKFVKYREKIQKLFQTYLIIKTAIKKDLSVWSICKLEQILNPLLYPSAQHKKENTSHFTNAVSISEGNLNSSRNISHCKNIAPLIVRKHCGFGVAQVCVNKSIFIAVPIKQN